MKSKRSRTTVSLGELIYVLFQEAGKVTPEPAEQKLMVYAALQDLLTNVLRPKHPIGIGI